MTQPNVPIRALRKVLERVQRTLARAGTTSLGLDDEAVRASVAQALRRATWAAEAALEVLADAGGLSEQTLRLLFGEPRELPEAVEGVADEVDRSVPAGVALDVRLREAAQGWRVVESFAHLCGSWLEHIPAAPVWLRARRVAVLAMLYGERSLSTRRPREGLGPEDAARELEAAWRDLLAALRVWTTEQSADAAGQHGTIAPLFRLRDLRERVEPAPEEPD